MDYSQQAFIGDSEPVVSRFNSPKNKMGNGKPWGGMWTSTFTDYPEYSDWWNWCNEQNFYTVQGKSASLYICHVRPTARILHINSIEDIKNAHMRYELSPMKLPGINLKTFDYESMSKDYDALHLSRRGYSEARNMLFDEEGYFWLFAGWDCESTCWLNMRFLSVVFWGYLDIPCEYHAERL